MKALTRAISSSTFHRKARASVSRMRKEESFDPGARETKAKGAWFFFFWREFAPACLVRRKARENGRDRDRESRNVEMRIRCPSPNRKGAL